MMLKKVWFGLFIVLCLLQSCSDTPLPKPASYLRLEYPSTNYSSLQSENPYSFEYPTNAELVPKKNNWMDIKYPALKATLVLSYMPVKDNLRMLFADAEKLTFKHMIKADDIQSIPFENPQEKVYGRMFEVYGDAATQIQFHATDSVAHFMTGALYFYAKPNYDSILPAVHHVRKDIVRLMETLRWKNH